MLFCNAPAYLLRFIVYANLEQQVKELNVRIVDLETKAYAIASRLKGEALRKHRNGERPPSGSRGSAVSERTHSRFEEEVKSYEVKIANMREAITELVSNQPETKLNTVLTKVKSSPPFEEGELQLTVRKAKRGAGGYKKQVLRY